MENKIYGEISDQYSALHKTLACCEEAADHIYSFYEAAEVETIVVIGCGSSYSLSCALANNLCLLLHKPSMAIAGGDLMIHMENYEKVFSGRTLLITISRSGSTHEILYACKQIRVAYPSVRILSFVCTEQSNVADVSDAVLEFPWAFDESVCQSRSVTNLYGGALYVAAKLANNDSIQKSLKLLAENGTAYLYVIEPSLKRLAGEDWANVMILCDGESFGVAEEAALACNEIAYSASSCKHVLDVRHGPVVLINEKTLVLAKLTKAGFDYEKSLIRDLLERKARVVIMSDEELPDIEGVAAQFAFGSEMNDSVSTMLILPVAQLISYFKALSMGLNPDKPEGLEAWIALK